MILSSVAAYSSLQAMAVLTIYYGSIRSLDGQKHQDEQQNLSRSDVYWFPLIASCTLFGLYCFIKYFSKDLLETLLLVYFCTIGVVALFKAVSQPVKMLYQFIFRRSSCILPYGVVRIKSPVCFLDKMVPYRFGKIKSIEDGGDSSVYEVSLRISTSDVICAVLVLGVDIYYFVTRNWIASNILALSFSYFSIATLNPDSFLTGVSLLCGLFVYDVFWVFGTNVMVTVAQNLNIPIKILFPKFGVGERRFAILGLGDIVIPGLFIASCLKYDYFRYKNSGVKEGGFDKTYFKTSIIFYALALTTTMLVMHVFQAPQPALLYISPACVLSVLFKAYCNGELVSILDFNSESGEEGSESKGAEDDVKKNEGGDVEESQDAGEEAGSSKKKKIN